MRVGDSGLTRPPTCISTGMMFTTERRYKRAGPWCRMLRNAAAAWYKRAHVISTTLLRATIRQYKCGVGG
eukprot:785125-Rhodomonas_salina.2